MKKKYSNLPLRSGVGIVVLNEIEAEQLGCYKDLEMAGRTLLKLGVETVVITLGSEGAMAICEGKSIMFGAPKMDVVDTAGAGDAFNAKYLSSYFKNNNINNCLKAAHNLGSKIIKYNGALKQ